MSNLVSDHHNYSSDPSCTCRQTHAHDPDDGVCRHCERMAARVEPTGAFGEAEPVLTCDICGEDGAEPVICPMQGKHKGNFCKAHGPSEEPGDNYYEGRY